MFLPCDGERLKRANRRHGRNIIIGQIETAVELQVLQPGKRYVLETKAANVASVALGEGQVGQMWNELLHRRKEFGHPRYEVHADRALCYARFAGT